MAYRLFVVLVVVGLCTGLPGTASAQEITGQIRGIVTDGSGAAEKAVQLNEVHQVFEIHRRRSR